MLQSAACCLRNNQVSISCEVMVWLERSSAYAMHNVQIKVPATLMYGTGKEGCGVRKPEPGMWDFFVEHLNDGVQPGVHNCLGAAALMLLCSANDSPCLHVRLVPRTIHCSSYTIFSP